MGTFLSADVCDWTLLKMEVPAIAAATTASITTSGETASVAATSGTVPVLPIPMPSTVSSSASSSRPLFPQPRLQLGNVVHPNQCNMYDRRRTFTQWDESQYPPLDEIVLSGLYYAGYRDCLVCFYCGIRLTGWERTDNVLVEHVRFSPNCGYLREIKGKDFICQIQRQLRASTNEQAAPNTSSETRPPGFSAPTSETRNSGGEEGREA